MVTPLLALPYRRPEVFAIKDSVLAHQENTEILLQNVAKTDRDNVLKIAASQFITVATHTSHDREKTNCEQPMRIACCKKNVRALLLGGLFSFAQKMAIAITSSSSRDT
jgi:hypothetical protein|mmetsp:Transcript_79669/g.124275  ORF Transcript_79669/g.124275 Transcript_79669/m.124275 type:complete len:109 (-) Transcript_79669:689-1015(-)